MINCNVAAFGLLCSQLMLYNIILDDSARGSQNADNNLPDDFLSDVAKWMKITLKVAEDFEWRELEYRAKIIESKISTGLTVREMLYEIKFLRDLIESNILSHKFYRYPNDKLKKLMSWERDWSSALKAFPSCSNDVLSAVDLWALGHPTACVFHLMRVLEAGLRALANNVGRDFGTQNWQNIIDQIESEIRNLGKTMPSGKEKSENLQFLSEAAKEFYYFKDGWRNYVSHNYHYYDDDEAYRALEHVRSFMTTLSRKLSEK